MANFRRPQACCQTVLPDRSLLIEKKMVENAKIQNIKCDILGGGRNFEHKEIGIGLIPNIPHNGEYGGILVFKFPIPHRENFVFPMGKIFHIFISKSPKNQVFFDEILSKCWSSLYNLIQTVSLKSKSSSCLRFYIFVFSY